MVHRRELDGSVVTFGNQGDLFGNAMTWWDHGTGSIWSQPLGEAILGPLRGERLELLPSTLTTWGAWRVAHPATVALDVRGWSTGFHLEDMAIVVEFGSEAVAYEIPALRVSGSISDVVSSVPIVVVIDPADATRWAVFSRVVDDRVVRLDLTPAGLVDRQSGTVFDPFLGVGVSGPLADQTLDKLPAFTAFPEDFVTFFPTGRVWLGDEPTNEG
jgi:hypothetical protein